MSISINSDNVQEFTEFLQSIIPRIQETVEEGKAFWKSNLTDLTAPCLIELWVNENSAKTIIFPKFPKQTEPLIIRTHILPSGESEAINSIQEWIDDPFWQHIPYEPGPRFYIQPGSSKNTFRHFLASLSRSIYEITEGSPPSNMSGKFMGISASMIPNGTFWDLRYLPVLETEAWQQALLRFPLKDYTKKEEKPDKKEKLTVKEKKQDRYFGCYMWPPVWLGDDFWLDVFSHVIAPEFRRGMFLEKFIGESTFMGNPIYFSKNGKLIVGTPLTKEDSLLILNKLMFSLRFLISGNESKRFDNKEIYPVSANELCSAEFQTEKHDDSTHTHIPKISSSSGSGVGDRGFWVSQIMERKPLSWKDDYILIITPQEFSQLIELSSKHYQNFETHFSFNENVMYLLLQSTNHNRNKEFLSGYILGFFALERIISDIWRKIAIKKLITEGMSENRARTRLKDGNWTLSLIIDSLTLLEVISAEENQILHKMRKLRNSLAHGGRGDELSIDKNMSECVLKWCMRLLLRVNITGDLIDSSEVLEEELMDCWKS